ncbi:MAG TPA: HemK2/MTQ2 family protein methyltransferase [Methanoregula sp.]|nr:HemK2/MTQ2 family protein methyltransferase [Methanoregula sp.]
MPRDSLQVYKPEADTCLLLKAAMAEIRPGERVLEVGTGSGLIAAELGRVAPVIATDINPHAAAAARGRGLEVIRADLLAGICGKFDLIVFNPPYLPTRPDERVDDWLEYALDGGVTGRQVIGRFAAGVGRVLAPGGRILLLVSSLTGPDEVAALFAERGYSSSLAGQERIEGEVLFVLKIRRDGH